MDAKYFGVIKIVFQLVLKSIWANISLLTKERDPFSHRNHSKTRHRYHKDRSRALKGSLFHASQIEG